VLTDRQFFQGSLEDMESVEEAVVIPVLRKDFTLSEYHLFQAAASGADAVLLIAATLTPEKLSSFIALSRTLGMDALVEVHTAEELKIAKDADADIIGVNNRDLRTFEVSLHTSLQLIDAIPEDCLAISESGLRTAQHLQQLRSAGFDAFLIGESFMSAQDPGEALAHLLASAAHGERTVH
jgi:indole-3-glycerol phosphate synthase